MFAGGGSRRTRRGGRPSQTGADALVLHVGRVLEVICSRILVAGGTDRVDLPWEPVTDRTGAGPLAGILAGLEAADTDLVAVVATHLPFANTDVLELLADRWMGEAAVVPLVDERIRPLHGVYATGAAPSVRRLVEAGKRSVVPALSELGARVVGPEVWGEADPGGHFARRIERPEELADLGLTDPRLTDPDPDR